MIQGPSYWSNTWILCCGFMLVSFQDFWQVGHVRWPRCCATGIGRRVWWQEVWTKLWRLIEQFEWWADNKFFHPCPWIQYRLWNQFSVSISHNAAVENFFELIEIRTHCSSWAVNCQGQPVLPLPHQIQPVLILHSTFPVCWGFFALCLPRVHNFFFFFFDEVFWCFIFSSLPRVHHIDLVSQGTMNSAWHVMCEVIHKLYVCEENKSYDVISSSFSKSWLIRAEHRFLTVICVICI